MSKKEKKRKKKKKKVPCPLEKKKDIVYVIPSNYRSNIGPVPIGISCRIPANEFSVIFFFETIVEVPVRI
jgi:predicted transcriptional regulator